MYSSVKIDNNLLGFFLQHNALKAITPATLDVLLKILSTNDLEKPTNEHRLEMGQLKDLVLKCLIGMVHVIHCCSPDQVHATLVTGLLRLTLPSMLL